jgi:heme/copper-type cytochrome/quinol oxidase subunit 2
MIVLYIVLGFLAPVAMVFAYSVWLQRRRRQRTSDTSQTGSDKEN